jgi:hypothetical protein
MGAILSISVYIDKYRYIAEDGGTHEAKECPMESNFAAWMIAGGPRTEDPHAARDREQLHAFRESQQVDRPSIIDRLRGISRPRQDEADLVCCPA